MKTVILDGYTANPGDLSWDGLKELGELQVYDRTSPEELLDVTVDNAEFLGWGNGDPAFKEIERPLAASLQIKPFAGKAQIIIRSMEGAKGNATVRIGRGVHDFSYL